NSDRTTIRAAPFFPSVTSRLPLQQTRCQNLNSRCGAALRSCWTGRDVQVALAFGIRQRACQPRLSQGDQLGYIEGINPGCPVMVLRSEQASIRTEGDPAHTTFRVEGE